MDKGPAFEQPAATAKRRRALLLANAQASRVEEQLPAAIERLQAAGLELIIQTPGDAAKVGDLIRQHRESVDCVIVAGGDGTLNAATEALLETGLPLGILPFGTANDLARTLGLPTEIDAACRVIAEGYLRRIDLGSVNGKHFLNAASLGLSVQVCRLLDKGAKKRWGILAYPFTAAKVLWQMRPFHAEIDDGQTSRRVKTVQITVGNGHFFGGGMKVVEDAAIDDQQLNLYSVEIRHWWQLPFLMWSLRRGQLTHLPQVRTLQGQYFEIKTRRHYWANTDGELTVRTPAMFRMVPLALAIFTPRRSEDEVRPTERSEPRLLSRDSLRCQSLSEKGSDPLEARVTFITFLASPERVRPLFG